MPHPSLDWLNDLPDLRVTPVTRVTPHKSATNAVTQADDASVTPVTDGAVVTLVTPPEGDRVTPKPAEILAVTPVTLVTPKTDGGLTAELQAGLGRLRTVQRPRITKPDVWPEIVADAIRLAEEGWAEQALSLGWHSLQLFGCSPAIGGDTDLDGLAVWLRGRRLLLIDERSAVAADGDRRACFIRSKYDGAAFLWDLADIQSRRARKL